MYFRLAATLTLLACAAVLTACLATEEDRKALAQGFSNYEARQFDAADAAAGAYITKYPDADDVDEAYYLRGLARYSKADRPAAAQDFLTASAKSKRDDLRAKSYGILAEMAYNGERWEQALDYFNKALTFYPQGKAPPAMYYRIAATLQNLGLWDKARPFFDVAIALKPDPVMLQHALQRRSATSFALQFGAFKELPRAAELVGRLRTAGIATTVASAMRENDLLFLVRSGSFHTFEEANFARQKLLAQYPLLAIVP